MQHVLQERILIRLERWKLWLFLVLYAQVVKSLACHDTIFWEWAAETWSWLDNSTGQSPKQIYSSVVLFLVKKTSKYFISAKGCQLWFFAFIFLVFGLFFFPMEEGKGKENTSKVTAKERGIFYLAACEVPEVLAAFPWHCIALLFMLCYCLSLSFYFTQVWIEMVF